MRLKVRISQIFKQLVNFLTLIARWQLTKQHHQMELHQSKTKACLCAFIWH